MAEVPLDTFLTALLPKLKALALPEGYSVEASGPIVAKLLSAKVVGKDIGMTDGIGLPFIVRSVFF